MKKTLVACLAVAALFAVATSANAITCTQDHRPAATLLIPYFLLQFGIDATELAQEDDQGILGRELLAHDEDLLPLPGRGLGTTDQLEPHLAARAVHRRPGSRLLRAVDCNASDARRQRRE